MAVAGIYDRSQSFTAPQNFLNRLDTLYMEIFCPVILNL